MAQKHTVRPGECLSTIAKRYGFVRWQTIYDAGENEAFRSKRPNPHVIYAGDEIVIPDKTPKEETIATGKLHPFQVSTPKLLFRMEMRDETMDPLVDYPFELYVDGALVEKGKTKADGLIEVPLPIGSRAGKLRFLGEEYQLDFGGLDPVSRVKGIQQRLNNLGYPAGPIDGIVGKKTRAALRTFQAAQKLDATGKIDDPTRKRLLELHDKDSRLTDPEEDMDFKEDPPAEPGDEPGPGGATVDYNPTIEHSCSLPKLD
jgi:Putative peptidoglycan binding domain/LysM domain